MWWVIDNRAWIGGNIRPHHAQAGPFETEKLAIAWMKDPKTGGGVIKPLNFKQWEEKMDKKRNARLNEDWW